MEQSLGMVENRDEHKNPVIRAFIALRWETGVEVFGLS